jgi:tetratricopeptide (TPR) repeat protein
MVIASWALFQGQLEEVERLAEGALRSGEAASADARCSYCLAMFVLRRDQGRLGESESLIRAAVDEFPQYGAFRCYVALMECELGDAEAARRALALLAADEFATFPRDDEWLFCLSLLAEVAAHVNDRETAAVLYRLLLPYADLNAMVSGEVALGSVARYLGLLATTLERWEDADTHFARAVASNEQMGARPWLARSQHDYARMLMAADRPGDRDRAEALLDAARALYHGVGMKSQEAKAQTVTGA